MTVAVCFFKAGTTIAAGPAMLDYLRAMPQGMQMLKYKERQDVIKFLVGCLFDMSNQP